jgi:hypothetical protein
MNEFIKSILDYFQELDWLGFMITFIIYFIAIVILYIIFYIVSSIVIGKSVVITKLIKLNESKTFDRSLDHNQPVENRNLDETGIKEDQDLNKEDQTLLEHSQREWNQVAEPIQAHQFYYLPAASVVIKATAKVIVIKSENDQIIQRPELLELQLENEVVLEPDTNMLFGITYKTFSFANDELHLNTNVSGLLENISATTEDRISNIIATISDAPEKVLKSNKEAAFVQRGISEEKVLNIENVITETVTYISTFRIESDDFQKGVFRRNWIINVDGKKENVEVTVNASFECRFQPLNKIHLPLNKEVDGVLTRPLTKLNLAVHLVETKIKSDRNKETVFKKEPSLKYEIVVPDTSVVIQVPIKRSNFVKKVNVPKFSNGLLVENYINKPSEVEAALSIPINILKAIFSIPAQLFSFKIYHLQKQTELETAKQNLAKAKLQSRIDQENEESLQLKARLETEQAVLESKKDVLSAKKEISDTQVGLENMRSRIQDLQTNIKAIEESYKDKNVSEDILIEAIEENEAYWKRKYNVIEISAGKKKINGIQTNINCIVFKPIEKLDAKSEEFVSIPEAITYTASDGVTYKIPTDVLPTKSLIKASLKVNKDERCDRIMSKKPGCSVSRLSSNATGTIGLKAFKNGNPYIVSCYHVLCAPELNNGIFEFDLLRPKADTSIISPSLEDNGNNNSVIAKVAEGKLTHYLDCAIAILINDSKVSKEICRFNEAPTKTMVITLAHAGARSKVHMSGRTSEYQSSEITCSYTSADITYEINGRNYVQTINGLICTTSMSDGGDSGAPVVDDDCNLIGIVVASSQSNTYIIPISRILAHFKLSLNNDV